MEVLHSLDRNAEHALLGVRLHSFSGVSTIKHVHTEDVPLYRCIQCRNILA